MADGGMDGRLPRGRVRRGRYAAVAGLAGTLLLWPVGSSPATASGLVPAPPSPGTLAEGPATQCAPAGTVRGRLGQYAEVTLCVTAGGGSMTVTAAADCRTTAAGARARVCRTAGDWTMHREPGGGPAVTPIPVPAGEAPATGALAGRTDYPGPGTYRVEADVRITAAPPADAPADSHAPAETLRGRVGAVFTLTEPKPQPAYRTEVAGPDGRAAALAPGTATLLTYTVTATGEHGDGSARLGLIGEAGSGMEVTSADARCVNPLPGRYPSTTRTRHALDCTLTDIQPGRPATVTVRATVRDVCSTLVAKLGHWTPRGQSPTGGMLDGPTVPCEPSGD
ncbi:hypothetical protein [Streptomyces lichenis]|uniref:DUF11 domain-containing protein n=1 Tax=Streptomyces lichenis TaxID=2306967 RepID=A0ABT0IGW8_9ACTN|nr:hypothetical protein [Streptomyces lichenis]MCK8680575.1 hypothetical protein [Streptomyces lichenis]